MSQRILADQETIRAALLTQRDRAAQALRESEARFRAIFTASPFGIAVADMEGRVLTANLVPDPATIDDAAASP